jgi:peptide/nickel transport system substrate-binding protein
VLLPQETVPGDHCTYVPNKFYYDQSKIVWGKVVSRYMTEPNTVLAAMKTGQVDVAGGDAATADAATAAGINVTSSGRPSFSGMYFWDKVGQLQKAIADVRVRQAMNYALDRPTIARALFGKYATPSSNPFPGSYAATAKHRDFYKYDAPKARSLLAAAGYPNGFTFKATLLGSVLFPAFKVESVAQTAQKYFADVGIKVDLNQPLTLAEFSAAYVSKSYSAVFAPYGGGPVYGQYQQRLVAGVGWGDQHGFRDREIEKLYYKGLRASQKGALRIEAKIIERSLEQAYFVPVVAIDNLQYNSKKVRLLRGGGGILEMVPASP